MQQPNYTHTILHIFSTLCFTMLLTYGLDARASISSVVFENDAISHSNNSLNDTINNTEKITDLENLIVEGRTQRIVKSGTEYIPGDRIKKASMDAYSLIRNLQLPNLDLSSNNIIKTVSGKNVTIFINYNIAREEQLEGLNCNNVLRIDVLQRPDDIRFRGCEDVINIITKTYNYGGYTSLKMNGETLSQDMLKGAIYSQIAYKRMNFNLWIGADGSRTNNFGQDGVEIFQNVYYNDIENHEIKKSVINDENNIKTANRQCVGLYASYQNSKFYCEHTIGFVRDATPKLNTNSFVTYNPELFNSSEEIIKENSKINYPYLNAYYYSPINNKNRISAFYTLSLVSLKKC